MDPPQQVDRNELRLSGQYSQESKQSKENAIVIDKQMVLLDRLEAHQRVPLRDLYRLLLRQSLSMI